MLAGGQGMRMPEDCKRLRNDFKKYMTRLSAGQTHSSLEPFRGLAGQEAMLSSFPRAGVITKSTGPMPRNFAWNPPPPGEAEDEGNDAASEEEEDYGSNWQMKWAERYSKGPVKSDYQEAFRWPQPSDADENGEGEEQEVAEKQDAASEQDEMALEDIVEESILEDALGASLDESNRADLAEALRRGDASSVEDEPPAECAPPSHESELVGGVDVANGIGSEASKAEEAELMKRIPAAAVDHVGFLLGGHEAVNFAPRAAPLASEEKREDEAAAKRGMPRAAVDHVAYLLGGGDPPSAPAGLAEAELEAAEAREALRKGLPAASVDHVARLLGYQAETPADAVAPAKAFEPTIGVMDGGRMIDVSEYQAVFQAPSRDVLLEAVHRQPLPGRLSNQDHVTALLRGTRAGVTPAADLEHLSRLRNAVHNARTKLKVGDITELCRMRKPPKPIIALLRGLARVLGMPSMKWTDLRNHLLRSRHQIPSLLSKFNLDSPTINVRALEFCAEPWAQPAAISRVSTAALGLSQWLSTLNTYTRARMGLTVVPPAPMRALTPPIHQLKKRRPSKVALTQQQPAPCVDVPPAAAPSTAEHKGGESPQDGEESYVMVDAPPSVSEEGAPDGMSSLPSAAPGSSVTTTEVPPKAAAVAATRLAKEEVARRIVGRPTKKNTTWGRKPNPLASKPARVFMDPILLNPRYPPMRPHASHTEYEAKYRWYHQA